MRVLIAPPVEQDLRFAVGSVVAVTVRDEHEVWRGTDPHAAEADLQPAHEIEPLDEHFALVKLVVAVGVLENDDAVARLVGRLAVRITVRLGHPHAAAMVEREGNGLHHVRLRRAGDGAKARWQLHRLGGNPGGCALEQWFFKHQRLRRLHGVGEARALGVKSEVVEIHMAIATRVLVNDANKN